MRHSFAAFDPLSSLNGYALQSLTPEVHAVSYDTYGKLHALGGPGAVIAAARPRAMKLPSTSGRAASTSTSASTPRIESRAASGRPVPGETTMISQTMNLLRSKLDRPLVAQPFSSLSAHKSIKHHEKLGKVLGIDNPFFRSADGIKGRKTIIDGKPVLELRLVRLSGPRRSS